MPILASSTEQKMQQDAHSAVFLSPELTRLLNRVQRETDIHPVTWLHCSYGAINAWVKLLQARSDHLLVAGLPTEDQFAFGPIRVLLRTLIPYVESEAPDLLAECAPELVNIMPELAEAPFGQRVKPLESLVPVPLGLARMLPRQSDILLRIVTRLGWFITQASQRLTLAQKPLLLLFPHIEQVDRPTLYTIYHLYQRARWDGLRILLLGEWLPRNDETIQRQHLFDAEYERQLLLTRFYQQVGPSVISTNIKLPSVESYAPMTKSIGSQEAVAYDEAQKALETVQLDLVQTDVLNALAISNQYFNVERILIMAEEALSHPGLNKPLTITLWQIVGSVHAALGNYSEATTCFQKGFDLTDMHTPIRAQMAMYLALVSAKRMGAFDKAREFLDMGYEAIEHLETAESAIERGWLHNVAALIAYRQRNYREAFSLTQEAIQFMKPYRDEAATGLKTNLVTNVSILFESANQPQRALDVWRLFKTFLGEANDLFDKHYLSRDAGLSLKAGWSEEALSSYQKALEAAVRVGDLVGIEATTRALVCLAYQNEDYDNAVDWAKRLPSVWVQLGDYEQLWRSWRALAACYYYVQDIKGAADALQQTISLLKKMNKPAEQAEMTAALDSLQAGDSDSIDWSAWLPELPDTILRWSPRLVVP